MAMIRPPGQGVPFRLVGARFWQRKHESGQRQSRFLMARSPVHRWFSGIGMVVFGLAIAAAGSYAQNPDLPTVSAPPPPSLTPLPPPPSVPAAPELQETVFQAPPELQRANVGSYLVYVNGDSPYLLQQVQTVEPRAFVQQYQGRPVIQVGTFSDEANARRQVEALRGQGVMAEVSYNSISYPPTANRSNYMVIIPGSRDAMPSLIQQAMRLGIRQESIQQRDAPLGPHLAIGPFASYGEAREASRYLHGGGLDARVHYSR